MTSAVLSLISVAVGQHTTTPQSGSDATKIYLRAKDSVVAIEVTTRDGMAYGTGFFFGDGKTVATCNHVLEGATKIVVRGSHGATWKPKSMSFNRQGDTVLLHLTAMADRTALSVAKGTQIGEPVFVIGNPLGVLTGSLSTGIVSAHRKMDSVPLVQTTAPISEGSSGSPVLDGHGRVLGMVSFTFNEGQNLNMAIGSEVLRQVAVDHRAIPLQALFEANAATGAPLKITRTASRPEASKSDEREALQAEIAQVDGRVIDAFVRWQVAAMAWSRAEGGVTEPDVRDRFDAFRSALSSEAIDRALGDKAKQAGKSGCVEQIQSVAQSLLRVGEDKFRQDTECAHLGRPADAVKRAATQYERLKEALCEFGAATEDPSWMDVASMYGQFPTPAKGECIMLHQNAFVDADLPRSTTIRDAMPGSTFRAGDKVQGARITGQPNWTPIHTWEDLWQFTGEHGEQLTSRGWEVQVIRDGQTMSLSMSLAGK